MQKPTPPELPGLPFVGHALEFQKDYVALLRRGYRSLGSVFTIKLGTRPAVVMIGPEYHKFFFQETDKSLSMHKTYAFLRAAFGEVAFVASPEVYQEQRPILHAPFKREKMIRYIQIMQLEVQAWLDSLGDEGEMEISQEMNTLVQNVAAHALMGQDFHQRMGREFWDLYLDIGQALDPMLPPDLPLPKFRRRDRAKTKMRAMLQPIIAERRRQPDAYDDFLQDFVNARDANGREIDDESIISLILGLMFAGHETTSGQAAWSIIQLLQHPDYLALVQAEIAERLPPGSVIDGRNLSSLNHIMWAVNETTRTNPSADILLRMTEEEIEVGNYRIPSDWIVIITAGVAHRLPYLFDDPDDYDPLRYAPGREEDKQDRFALIGFGGGVHKCAGMNFANNEMMIIIALLFQQFELELISENPTIARGMGANRPTPTLIRYRRKQPAENSPVDQAVEQAGD
jgi:sterol 14alpha-demethylase